MPNTTNCPDCGTTAFSDVAHRKTCVNMKCSNYDIIYLHHEWIAQHEEIKQPLSVSNEVNRIMVEF